MNFLHCVHFFGLEAIRLHRLYELCFFRNQTNKSQAAINEATGLAKVPSALLSEKDEYIYRSFLAMGQYGVVLSEIKEKPSTSLGIFCLWFLNCKEVCQRR